MKNSTTERTPLDSRRDGHEREDDDDGTEKMEKSLKSLVIKVVSGLMEDL